MSFEWQSFLELAKKLVRETSDEASIRSAISRAYYAIYHVAKSSMKKFNVEEAECGTSHQKVWDGYMRSSNTIIKQIGIDGDRLKNRRVNADYHDKLRPNAGEAVENGEKLLKELAALEKILLDNKTKPPK